jgi:hypothetical protein
MKQPALTVEVFDDDDLETIDGFVIVDRRVAWISLKTSLSSEEKALGCQRMLAYAERNSDLGVYYWNIADADEEA